MSSTTARNSTIPGVVLGNHIPASKRNWVYGQSEAQLEDPKSLPLHIFSDLKNMKNKFAKARVQLQGLNEQLACNFSLTISLWKDNLGKNAYCCLMAHFIDDDWELKKRILAFKSLELTSRKSRDDLDSDFGILDSALKLREIFCQLEKIDISFKVNLSMEEWNKALSLHNCLKAVLDPRIKNKLVEFSFDDIYGLGAFGEFSSTRQSTTGSSVLDSFSRFASTSNFSKVSSKKSELDCYLEEPLLPLDGAFFDMLGWWCVNSERFPTLGMMARDLLAMPNSVVPPHSDFNAMMRNPA
ncbi:hypothetical protein PTKIN_Ptkin09bG0269500 [Pterospermum kingtungense]